MDTEKTIRQYLQSAKMMQLATVADDQPWCCSLFYAPDEELNIYWISLPDTRHSQAILSNNRVAATVAIAFTPGKPVVGVSIEGVAQIVDDPDETRQAIRQYATYCDRGDEWYEDYMAGKNPHKLYKLRPKLFVLFDVEHFPDDPRQEWSPHA